jgi:Domain of Unknown Function (DUF1080)
MMYSWNGLCLAVMLGGSAMAAEKAPEFVELFNGKDLSGWQGKGYEVVDGAIVCTPEGRNLMTEKRYSEYVLDFEFLLPPGGNNGLGIHYPGDGDAAYTGMELQILDDTSPQYKDLKDYQFHGSIYTMVAAKKAPLKPVGEWNRERVTVTADSVRVELNGVLITDANLDELEKKHPKHLGVKRRAGHLGWCGHGDRVSFRNIRIAETAPTVAADAWKAEGFVPLFDGTSFSGWRLEKGSEGHWTVANGVLHYDGKSQAAIKDLWTEKEYKDTTIRFDWRWSGMGPRMMRPVIDPASGLETGKKEDVEELDSGFYLRGNITSQVNLWNWPVGSGEVYGYRTNKKLSKDVWAGVTPKEKADRALGEWNRMEVTMKGDRLSVTLNGKKVIDAAQLPDVPAMGRLGLQHHGSAIDFANVWVKEL